MSDATHAPGLAVGQDLRAADVQDGGDAPGQDDTLLLRPETPGPGAQLAHAREAQGLSLGDVARQLKLAVRQVEALERDDYDAFPSRVFVRGFLRNYAKLLQLDFERQIAGVGAVESSPTPSAEAAPVAERPQPVRWLRWALVALLALLIAFALFRPGPDAGLGGDSAAPVRFSAPPADAPPAESPAPTPMQSAAGQ